MGKLADQITRTLLPRMILPEPIRLLLDWIEANKTYIDRPTGERIGFLFPEEELKRSWTDTERHGGTNIEFFAEGNVNMKYWFRHEKPEALERICVFAKTGADGSMAAFWLDDAGNQRIVHLGSGSGSVMVCVLAETPIDFLRLIAIGYDEICWSDVFSSPPNVNQKFVVHPNKEFRDWVSRTFHVSIPATANEIVKHPNDMGDSNPTDEFAKWVKRCTQ